MSNNLKEHTKNINEIAEMMTKVRSINEAISFDEDIFEDETPEFNSEVNDTEDMSCQGKECYNDDIDGETDIDRIREIALRGMLKYVKQSNCAEYETLKKIFQFCDKVNNDKGEEVEKK